MGESDIKEKSILFYFISTLPSNRKDFKSVSFWFGKVDINQFYYKPCELSSMDLSCSCIISWDI